MEIYIVRHGLSEGNAKMIFQGRMDYPLAREGRYQAQHLGKYFKERKIKFDRIVSSPLKRAYETAEIISSEIEDAPAIEIEPEFQEVKIGKLEGMKSDDVADVFPDFYQRTPEQWLDFSDYGGESWLELRQRVDSVMHKYAPQDILLSDVKLLITAHGGVMRAITRNLLEIEEKLMFLRVENCCHFKICFTKTRMALRRYIDSVIPLTTALVNGEPYQYTLSDDFRAKSVS